MVGNSKPSRSVTRLRALVLLGIIVVAGVVLLATLRFVEQAVEASRNDGDRDAAVDGESLGIACVGPLSGSRAYLGSGSCRGAALLIDEINAAGGFDGLKLVLRRFDDQADPSRAAKLAEEIGASSTIAAVIGHNTSATTIPAARIYRQRKIPAISPSATNPRVTTGNAFMFRAVFNDNIQAELLAHYMRSVLEHRTVAVAYVDDAYGRLLDERFVETASQIGLHAAARVPVPVEPTEKEIKRIADALSSEPAPDGILLALFRDPAILLIEELRHRGVAADLVGSDALATVVERRDGEPGDVAQGARRPTDGMYVSTPFSAEAASSQAREFLRRYRAAYGEDAGWHAVHGYDSALVIAQALRAMNVGSDVPGMSDLRARLRDQMAAFDRPSRAVQGLMGPIFFDANGDVLRPLFIAQAAGQNLSAAPQQLQLVDDPAQVAVLRAQGENVVELGDHALLQITQVIRTGLQLIRVSEIDDTNHTFRADFEVWFRGGGKLDPNSIVFPDALEPIELRKPIAEVSLESQSYHAFVASGTFAYQRNREHIITGERDLVIRYRHKTRDLARLVLVPDRGRMGLSGRQSWGDRLHVRRDTIVPTESGWVLTGGTVAQDSEYLSTLGNPLLTSADLPFSTLTAAVHLQKAEFSLRRYLEEIAGKSGSWIGVAGFAVLLLLTFAPGIRGHHPIIATLVRLALFTVLILMAERAMVESISAKMEIYQLEATLLLFKSLWWIIPALLIIVVLRPLVWTPMEQRTGHPVPKIATLFTNLVILAIAGLAIMAIVFEQSLTSIGVASGVLTIVLGFALQSLILDAFAGLLLNIERPFRIGDKIMLNEDPRLRGHVTEMNWRTTKIETEVFAEVVVVPNSEVSRAKILNYASTGPQWVGIFVILDHTVRPEDAERMLEEAANTCRGTGPVLDSPGISKAFEWEQIGVRYFVGVKANLNETAPALVKSPLIMAVEQRLAREGIKPTVPIHRVSLTPEATGRDFPEVDQTEPSAFPATRVSGSTA